MTDGRNSPPDPSDTDAGEILGSSKEPHGLASDQTPRPGDFGRMDGGVSLPGEQSRPIAPEPVTESTKDYGAASERLPNEGAGAPGPAADSKEEFAGASEKLTKDLFSASPGHVLFGRYLVVRKLGQGGMGVVWLVRHLQFDSERALKLIVTGVADDQETRARFKREARIMDRLNHPNAVRIYDAQFGKDVAFIEMEYIRGKSLKDVLVPGEAMPPDWVADLLDQLCDVLQAANDEEIIHRDMKPSNLMLVEDRRRGTKVLKLLDFGIGKVPEDDALNDPLTVPGSFLGTAPYSSPEQIRGDKVDARSDLYSVGVILYELLTGHRPFNGNIGKLFHQHTTVAPRPFAATNAGIRIPLEVEQVVMKCLAKVPEDRPQSPRELAEMFHRALASSLTVGPSVPTGPPTTITWPLGETSPSRGGHTTRDATQPVDLRTLPLTPSPVPPTDPDPDRAPRPEPHESTPTRRPSYPRVLAGITLAVLLSLFSLGFLVYYLWFYPIQRQIEIWRLQGFEVHGEDGYSRGWPTTLRGPGPGGRVRFRRTPEGIYLPQGYQPSNARDPEDDRPRTLTHADGTTYLRIAGGTFTMGWDDDWGTPFDQSTQPGHRVKLSGFYMQKTEVTNGEFERYLQGGPGLDSCPIWKSRFDLAKFHLGEEQARKLPAVGIPWQDAEDYARTRGGRLPTEAQREFAARSRGRAYRRVSEHQGFLGVPDSQLANIDNRDYPCGVTEVAMYPEDVTAQGVCDLIGNAREWCRDAWRKRYKPLTGLVVDPWIAPDSSQQDVASQQVVVRGGSFLTEVGKGQTTHREPHAPGTESIDLGFRIIIECPEGPPDAR